MAPAQRVWNLLAKALYQCLPLEKMKIIDENSFSAELLWNLAFIHIRFYSYGKFIDILPFESLSCALLVKKGVLKLNLSIIFNLEKTDEVKTRVTCRAIAEDKGTGGLISRFTRRPQQNFVEQVFHAMTLRLKQLC